MLYLKKIFEVDKMKKIIVIGGGPAGMMAAIRAAENGVQVILFEKNNQLSRKLSISKFLNSALNFFTSK